MACAVFAETSSSGSDAHEVRKCPLGGLVGKHCYGLTTMWSCCSPIKPLIIRPCCQKESSPCKRREKFWPICGTQACGDAEVLDDVTLTGDEPQLPSSFFASALPRK